MKSFGRAALIAGLIAIVVVVVAGFVYRSWITAQVHTTVTLYTTLQVPVLADLSRLVTGEPESRDERVVGIPTTIVEPAGEGPYPTVVFVNGATPIGREEPAVERLARGLARAGYRVLVPDLPGLREGEISAHTVSATVEVIRSTAPAAETRGGKVGLVGVSVGASLALLAAEDPDLAGLISTGAGIAPYTDLKNALRLATTGTYYNGERLVPYDSRPYLTLIVARSMAHQLPGEDREAVLEILPPIEAYHPPKDEAPDPFADLRELPPETFGREARPLIALLTNRDPERFDELYAALVPETQEQIERLSPIEKAGRLDVPVELASGPEDAYFPVYESFALASSAPDVRVTVTPVLSHADPEISPRTLSGLLDFNGFVVRTLREIRQSAGN
jgi:pimeloyl-ACP methyl ester carboxylesterase